MNRFQDFVNSKIVYKVNNAQDFAVLINLCKQLPYKFTNMKSWSSEKDSYTLDTYYFLQGENKLLISQRTDLPIVNFNATSEFSLKALVGTTTIVKLADDSIYFITTNMKDALILVSMEKANYNLPLASYSDNLEDDSVGKKSIVALKNFPSQLDALLNIKNGDYHRKDFKWDWEYMPAKKMTQHEIEQELGYKIEIVDKHTN